MGIAKKQKGRPRKSPNSLEFWRFVRAAMVMYAYDAAREMDEKHSVAVAQAVDFVRQHHPAMPISETEVRRVLSTWRPKGSHTILRFECSNMTKDDLRRYRWIWKHLALLKGKKGLKVELPTRREFAGNKASLTIRFGERPTYPRHNRKIL
jgi:hypothetical protein